MKNLLKIVSIIGLTVITQIAYSAAVTDTFTTGDILTAEKLNNIKSAVNDNDTRISDIVLTPGPAGAAGAVGGIGATGAVGTTGSQGLVGPTGAAGATGTAGAVGGIGNTGAKGDTGAAGAVGSIGATGAAGAQGANSTVAGPTGPAGADSTVAGPTGPAGLGAVAFSSAPTANDDMNTYTVGTVWIDTFTSTAYILVDNSANAAVWTVLSGSATGSLYAIGDTGPAGGIVFYITDGGLHGLEAAAVDQVSTQWGCYNTLISGANNTAVGSGAHNTSAIISSCNETTAASVAAAYGPGWYLPSKDELNLLYAQKVAGVVGGFASSYYWSSSQYNSSYAWAQYFGSGNQGERDKSFTLGVRAVRAF